MMQPNETQNMSDKPESETAISSPWPDRSEWENIRKNNPIVSKILRAGGTPEDCCVVLARALEQTAEKAIRYMAIAPRKYRLQDGKVMIWRCPDELIPETDMSHWSIT
jgi:hypothetical protein